MIKIAFIDDHAIVRAALRKLLQEEEEMTVIGETSTSQEGIRLVCTHQPDVVLLDFMLPDMPGVEIIQNLVRLSPNIKILVLSSITQDLPIFSMFKAGAWGYLPKDVQKEVLIHAIKTVSAGYKMIPPSVAVRFALSKTNFHQKHGFGALSKREKEIMGCVIRGISVDEISKKFGISNKTVHSLRSRIFRKIGVQNDLDLTLLAVHYGIVKFEELDKAEMQDS